MGGPGKIENLKMWKPGQSGNPRGGSRKTRLLSALRDFIEENDLEEELVKVLFAAAIDERDLLQGEYTSLKDGQRKKYRRRPNPAFFQMILDRIEGKVDQKVNVSAGGDLKSIAAYLDGFDDPDPMASTEEGETDVSERNSGGNPGGRLL
jgi:hypothetical protein